MAMIGSDLLVLTILLLFVCILASICLLYRPPYDDPLIDRLRRDVLYLDPRLRHLRFFSSDESCIKRKQDVFLCLKDENNNYYDYNMLVYVAIHECAHALSPTYDDVHESKEFQENFQILLNRATELGIYDPSQPLLQHYCGIDAKKEPFSSRVFRWMKPRSII